MTHDPAAGSVRAAAPPLAAGAARRLVPVPGRAGRRARLAAGLGAFARGRARASWPWALGLGLLAAAGLAALTRGAADIAPGAVLRVLLGGLPAVGTAEVSAAQERIVLDIRLPRVIAAGAVGAALAFSGAAYQGVFRNPLADPYLIGVASGAALGASLAIVSPLGQDAWGFGWTPLFAFAGALATVAIVSLLASGGGGGAADGPALILAGVALSAVFGAATAFLLLTGGERARPIFSFLFGGFQTSNWERLAWAAPWLLAGAAGVAVHARVLNVLQLDEEQAAQLGVRVARTKLAVLAAASLTAAAAVAVAGVIGFVGLIAPHAVRLMFGGDHRRLLPLAALYGAAFLIAVDLLARTALAPQEVPVGVLTAMLGGPFFLWLLRARRAALA